MNIQRDQELVRLDPKIERTFQARRSEQQQGLAGVERMAEETMADDKDRAIR
ncbi:hypothetical protein TorRG33x02_174660, partial [Trema orientale]